LTLPTPFQYGDVYTIFDYEFEDQGTADSKYFVVMGVWKGQICGFITTSQEKGGRKRVEGCHHGVANYPSNYYLKIAASPFHTRTWVILHTEWQGANSLAAKVAAGRAVRVYQFADNQLRAFRNCFEGSDEWFDVCAEYMYGGKTKT
jgi:hypothetical protein